MKKLILCLSILIYSSALFAQSISTANLTINPSPISNTVLVANLDVTNNTSSSKDIICSRTSNILCQNPAYPGNADSGHLSSFCWDQCYPTWVDLSGPLTVGASSTDHTHFIGDLETQGINGTSSVTYCFYVQGNPNDQTCVTINYNFSTGIATIEKDKEGLSAAHPNPADAFTTLTYSLKADPSAYKIEVVNMLGSKVADYAMKGRNGVITIPTNNLVSGIYFYVLKQNNKTISSQKLVVSHK